MSLCIDIIHYVVQSKKTVTAHFSSKEWLPFGFAEYNKYTFSAGTDFRRQNLTSIWRFKSVPVLEELQKIMAVYPQQIYSN